MVVVTDRNMTIAERSSMSRSTEYEVSAIVMQLQKGADGKEQGTGTLIAAAKLGFDKEKKQIKVESLGIEPVRLTDIKREK